MYTLHTARSVVVVTLLACFHFKKTMCKALPHRFRGTGIPGGISHVMQVVLASSDERDEGCIDGCSEEKSGDEYAVREGEGLELKCLWFDLMIRPYIWMSCVCVCVRGGVYMYV